VGADRYLRIPHGAARVRRERHLARPVQAQPSAIHRSWETSWITDPLDWTRRPSRDRDDQRPGVLGAARLATTIRNQQQQPDHKQASHSSLTATAKQWFPARRRSAPPYAGGPSRSGSARTSSALLFAVGVYSMSGWSSTVSGQVPSIGADRLSVANPSAVGGASRTRTVRILGRETPACPTAGGTADRQSLAHPAAADRPGSHCL
jgi:hypothetical protein